MRVVVALGGNALLRRGEPLTAENQRANARIACKALAPVALEHELVISHGNGPQVGLLALQGSAYTEVEPCPLDLLGAQTEGMIGYLIQQELGNELPQEKRLASLLTLIEVDPGDPAFGEPTKPIGPIYRTGTASGVSCRRRSRSGSSGSSRAMAARAWGSRDLCGRRRHSGHVHGRGGAGRTAARRRRGGIDKDLGSALLAKDLGADALAIVTDVDAVYRGWAWPEQRAIRRATPAALAQSEFAAGSMGPKVRAVCSFVEETGGIAAIGSIADTPGLLSGDTGTTVTRESRRPRARAGRVSRRRRMR